MMPHLIAGLIFVLSFFLRLYPRLKLKFAIGSDNYSHLSQAQHIRDNNFLIPNKLERVVINHKNSYPYLYHFILALFPKNARFWAERTTGAFFDTSIIIIFYFFFDYINELNNIPNKETIKLIVILAYAISPALLRFTGSPRAYQGSPRIFGQMLYILHIISFFAFASTSNYEFALISSISCGLIFIAAKFATQVLVFFALIFSVFFGIEYIIIIITGFLFCIIISFGLVFRILHGHVAHTRFLQKYWDIAPKTITIQEFFFNLADVYKSLKIGNLKNAIKHFFSIKHPIYRLAFLFPYTLIVFNIDFYNQYKFLYLWLLAAVILYIFTSIRQFRFLGENFRYTEFALLPAILLTTIFLFETNIEFILYTYLIFCLISAIYYINEFIIINKPINSRYFSEKKLFDKINTIDKGIVLAVASCGHSAMFFSNFNILSPILCNLDEKLFPKKEYNLLCAKNGFFPSKNIKELIKYFNVKYLVIKDNEITYYTTNILKDKTLFFENVKLIYKINDLNFYKTINHNCLD